MKSRSIARYVPRRPSRHAVRLGCQVIRERDFKLVSDQILDISEAGMLVVPKLRILTGESLIVSFMAPFTRNYIDAEATVARVVHGRRLGDMGRGLGISFDWLGGEGRDLLRSQLAIMPSMAPKRRVFS